ncbi:MAG: XRE family transcriptional regulator [Verrucomicrobiota bacterium]|jgi:HTH-type transcriptional regulator/antitoxin HigA|nr:XRE family transcriptional regulator [Verrucomicrobiota bacterium]
MKTLAQNIPFKSLPSDYSALCRNVWLPRPIRDKTDYQAALDALAPLWGHEKNMSRDQSDWFALVADLVAEWEDAHDRKKAAPLPLAQRLAGLLEAHGMTAADLGRLLELEASMGSKIINGTRQLTAAHIRKLSAHFALPADYFL